ncbi:MAG: 5'-nucleotidase, lipoprotein e(P4) family [Flavobacteriales bacterium]|nr:5'-nucleotidase, lipoprotein e(P4) family [Flavobacteriales bacterium]
MPRNAPPLSFLALIALSVAACRTSAPVAQSPTTPNVQAQLAQQNVDAVIYQHFSAEVHRLYQQGYELARLRLDAALAKPWPKPPAVVVDIDETVLDNSPYQVTNATLGRTYTPATWKEWTAKGTAKALPGAVEFLNYAKQRGCAVYYISNRETDELGPTLRNLAETGFPMADTAHVLLMAGTSDKTLRRDRVNQTHHIILQVGDQLTDFDQGLKNRGEGQGKPLTDALRDTLEGHFILLPNPMYGAWLDAITGRDLQEIPARKAAILKQDSY